MTNRLFVSVAAIALLAGTGLADAQGAGTEHETPSAGAPAQQGSGAAEHGAPSGSTQMNHHMTPPSSGARGNQRAEERMSPEGKKGQQAQDDMKQDNMKKDNSSKSMRSETNQNGKADRENMKAEDQNHMKSDRNAAETGKSSNSTVGQAGAGAKLSTEQRTKITTVIRNEHIQPVTDVNFSVAIGTRVPHTVSFHPLPEDIVTIYPSWRGYEFFLVRDQIVVVDPHTLEIVAILDA